LEPRNDLARHGTIERVELLGPVELNAADAGIFGKDDIVGFVFRLRFEKVLRRSGILSGRQYKTSWRLGARVCYGPFSRRSAMRDAESLLAMAYRVSASASSTGLLFV
jgi:hypothetical protein